MRRYDECFLKIFALCKLSKQIRLARYVIPASGVGLQSRVVEEQDYCVLLAVRAGWD